MSNRPNALGFPRDVFKTCPAGRHVIETRITVCPYCQEDQDAGSVNRLDAQGALRDLESSGQLAIPNPPPPPPAPAPASSGGNLMQTQVNAAADPWAKIDGQQGGSPPGQPAAPISIGPSSPAVPPGQAAPSSPPAGPQTDGDVGRTQPLAAVVKGDPATQVMVASQRPTTPVLGWLRGLNGKIRGESYEVRHGRNIVGSDETCSVVIPSQDILPKHVSIMANDRGFVATLLDSSNILEINDSPAESQPLVDGDLITLGPAKFRFRCLSAEDLEPHPRGGHPS